MVRSLRRGVTAMGTKVTLCNPFSSVAMMWHNASVIVTIFVAAPVRSG